MAAKLNKSRAHSRSKLDRATEPSFFRNQALTYVRVRSFVRPLSVSFAHPLCTANCDADAAAAAAAAKTMHFAPRPSVRPRSFVLPPPSSFVAAYGFGIFISSSSAERASGAIERQEGGPVAAGRDRGRGLPNAFGPYYTK